MALTVWFRRKVGSGPIHSLPITSRFPCTKWPYSGKFRAWVQGNWGGWEYMRNALLHSNIRGPPCKQNARSSPRCTCLQFTTKTCRGRQDALWSPSVIEHREFLRGQAFARGSPGTGSFLTSGRRGNQDGGVGVGVGCAALGGGLGWLVGDS